MRFLLEVLIDTVMWYLILSSSFRRKIVEIIKLLMILLSAEYLSTQHLSLKLLLFSFLLALPIYCCLNGYFPFCKEVHRIRGCFRQILDIPPAVQNLQLLVIVLWIAIFMVVFSLKGDQLLILVLVLSLSYFFQSLIISLMENMLFKTPQIVSEKKQYNQYGRWAVLLPDRSKEFFPCDDVLSRVELRKYVAYWTKISDSSFLIRWKMLFVFYIVFQIAIFLWVIISVSRKFNFLIKDCILTLVAILIFVVLWNVITIDVLSYIYSFPFASARKFVSIIRNGWKNYLDSISVFRVDKNETRIEDRSIYQILADFYTFSSLNRNPESNFLFSVIVIVVLTVIYTSVVAVLGWNNV